MRAMEEIRRFTAKNGEEITLRPARPQDAREIIETVRATALERSYVLMEHYGRDPEAERRYISAMDRRKNLLLVACRAGCTKGMLVGSLAALQADEGQRPETAHVLRIGLHLIRAYRGVGIGSQMLQYTSEWAKEHGFKKLEADIFTTNQRSLHLFSRAGFSEEGTRRKRILVGNEYIDEVFVGKVLE